MAPDRPRAAPEALETRPASSARAPYIAVVGPADASAEETDAAEAVGGGLASAGAVVVTGGDGGVMAAACRGAVGSGGTTLGILPGRDRSEANSWVTIAVATGLGELRNGLVIRAADAVIAVGGAYGTLSEVALALKTGVPILGLRTWPIDGIEHVGSPERAVLRALQCVGARP